MTLGEQLAMDFFIEGVKGEAPNPGAPLEGEPAPFEASGTGAAEMPKAAFIYVGPVGDLGWSYAHDQGRLKMAEALGVETAYSELVAEGPDAARVIRDYAEKGYNLDLRHLASATWTSVHRRGRGVPRHGLRARHRLQDRRQRGHLRRPRLPGLVPGGHRGRQHDREQQAGLRRALPHPRSGAQHERLRPGRPLGQPRGRGHARSGSSPGSTRPRSARRPRRCSTRASTSSPARATRIEPDKLAQEKGIYAIGYNAVSRDVAPDALLTAPIWDWGVYYKQAVAGRRWTARGPTTPVWWGMAEGLLDLAPIADFVPAGRQGRWSRPRRPASSPASSTSSSGPINDNTGVERVAAGVSMTDEEKLAFDWLVEGVKAQIPQVTAAKHRTWLSQAPRCSTCRRCGF